MIIKGYYYIEEGDSMMYFLGNSKRQAVAGVKLLRDLNIIH